MDATAWLRLVGGHMPEPLFGRKLTRVLALAERVNNEFRPELLTADTARQVAKALPDSLPSGDQITAALRQATAEVADKPPPTEETPEQRRGRIWRTFIGDRLRAGSDPAHLCSLLRTYAPASELPGLLRDLFPEQAEADAAHAAEVRRDKGRAAEAAATAVALALRSPDARRPGVPNPPQPKRQSSPAPEPKREPLDPHSPPPELSWRDLKRQLARLEIEAGSNDPPPNAAARIERLRVTLGAMEAEHATA